MKSSLILTNILPPGIQEGQATSSPLVLLIQLQRPPVNAFDQSMWEEMREVFERVNDDGCVQAVVIGSALSNIWTAGMDVSQLSRDGEKNATDPARKSINLRKHILDFQDCITAIERCRAPVIAAVHGPAIGLGIDILSACDIRYASTSAEFSIKEVDVGIAADIGTLARFPKVTGNGSAAMELSLTGREFGADEAQRIGFVSRVVEGGQEEVTAAAIELARLIASKSPIAVLGTKHLLLHSRDHSVKDSLEYTATWNSLMLQTQDIKASMIASKAKKPPRFGPLPAAKL